MNLRAFLKSLVAVPIAIKVAPEVVKNEIPLPLPPKLSPIISSHSDNMKGVGILALSGICPSGNLYYPLCSGYYRR